MANSIIDQQWDNYLFGMREQHMILTKNGITLESPVLIELNKKKMWYFIKEDRERQEWEKKRTLEVLHNSPFKQYGETTEEWIKRIS
jgi:hypothetical protein